MDIQPQTDRLAQLLETQNSLIREQIEVTKDNKRQLEEQNRLIEALGKISLKETLGEVDQEIQGRQLSMLETMEQIRAGKSIARWGDGEIRLMLQPEFELSFQRPNQRLAATLKQIIRDKDASHENLLLAFPTVYVSRLWMGIWAETWHKLKPLLQESNSKWANTHVSRPLFFQKHGQIAIDAWRSVWEDKHVCVVAGRGSRFELLPQLFDNVQSVTRIDAPPRDAFDGLQQITEEINRSKEFDIYLCALGPTGTVLAAFLSSPEGGARHAIDIGHLASSYANVFLGGKFPEQVKMTS
ncbi:GT-D fold domain-containing glycosyltransferase [Brevibacterium aurantiacum]|uniref:GT-D fold domain-containing glycosyltransferase n=1 Tax=Brevibacterium aurantiacum TaxID=273384 RepID=UPI001868748E|nr:GT-D fold domain-containing glycosyltransferase [Brevibacterium aurantiacum]